MQVKHCHFICMKYAALDESLMTNVALRFTLCYICHSALLYWMLNRISDCRVCSKVFTLGHFPVDLSKISQVVTKIGCKANCGKLKLLPHGKWI